MPALAAERDVPFSLPDISSDSEGSSLDDEQPNVIVRSRFNWEEEEAEEGASVGTASGTPAGQSVCE